MNKMDGNCILIGAGDLTISQIPVKAQDLCIAVDGGFTYCRLLEIEPDYVIGDFDSLGMGAESCESSGLGEEDQLRDFSLLHPERVIKIPRVKDDTDMLAAIRLGLKEGYKTFHLYAGGGGRLEHTIANIQCLLYLKEQGAVGYMMDGTGMILVAKEESVSFREELEGYLSLFSLGDEAVVSIKGMKYELDHQTITNSFPIGVSNEFIGEKGCINVHRGAAVIIVSWAE